MCEHLTFEHIQYSLQGHAIYKDECMCCFANQKSEGGIDVCLKTFRGHCPKHSAIYYQKTKHPIVLNMRQVRIEDDSAETEEKNKITKVAIGKPGGIDFEEDRWECWTVLKCLACKIELDKTAIAELIDSLVLAQSAFLQSGVEEWEMEIKPCPHTKALKQLPSGHISAKSLAKCNDCDLSANLWLCLTCGNLGCGRKNYDGSGGNNHGVEHTQKTGHPLAVKMGTITPEGTASVHCYACDEEVIDENLADHLRHFGIDVAKQVKTEKTIAEMELQFNLNLTLSKAVEKGRVLVPQFGPGFTGLQNLGNSCYMNSVVQCLFDIQTFKDNYDEKGLCHLENCPKNPAECHACQFSKLAYGLYSGEYSSKKERTLPVPEGEDPANAEIEIYQDGITPRSFKSLMGQGHPEFKRSTQQDAYEYLQHLFTLINKSEKMTGLPDSTRLFNFDLQTKLQCQKCKGVKYSKANSSGLLLFAKDPGSGEAEKEEGMETDEETTAEEKKKEEEVEDIEKLPPLDFDESLKPYSSEETVTYQCPCCKEETTFSKSLKFKTFPEYLIVCMQRFKFDGWVPQKLPNPLNIPLDNIDLTTLQAQEGAEGEVILPDEDLGVSKEPEVNPEFLTQLEATGFPTLACKHALVNTGNSSAEDAMNWLMSHIEDPILNQPLVAQDDKAGDNISPESVSMVCSMGFDEKIAKIALKNTDGNVERAVDYLFSHDPSELLAEADAEANAESSASNEAFVSEGAPVYEIKSFITHLGKSIGSGHYVCHVKRGDDWIYFNDDKVATSSDPPYRGAYIYFLRKKGSKYQLF